MMGPTAASPRGWVAGEAEGLLEDVRWVRARYTIDNKRIVAHGLGVGGQMAYYLGFNQRDVIRGWSRSGRCWPVTRKDPDPAAGRVPGIGGATRWSVRSGGQACREEVSPSTREMAISGKEM